jgi:hypothetical protein
VTELKKRPVLDAWWSRRRAPHRGRRQWRRWRGGDRTEYTPRARRSGELVANRNGTEKKGGTGKSLRRKIGR